MPTVLLLLHGHLKRAVLCGFLILCGVAGAPLTSSQTLSTNDGQALAPAQIVARELAGAETHRYTFDLKANEFFQVRVEQKGIDVALRLLGANGKILATMDSPNGKQGAETLTWVGEQPGRFVLEVSCLEAKAAQGSYSVQRNESRAATALDRRRVEIERLFANGVADLANKDRRVLGLEEASEAERGWEELHDQTMLELTVAAEVGSSLQDLNGELRRVQVVLQEGQTLSNSSKSNSTAAEAKLSEALALTRLLALKLADPRLVERIGRVGANSGLYLSSLRRLQLLAELNEGLSLDAIGTNNFNVGEWQQAVDNSRNSISVYDDAVRRFGNPNDKANQETQILSAVRVGAAHKFINIGQMLKKLGQRQEAIGSFNEAITRLRALFAETHNQELKFQEGLALAEMGLTYFDESQTRKLGLDFLEKAIDCYRPFPDKRRVIANLMGVSGGQYMVELDYESAFGKWNSALDIYRELSDPVGEMEILKAKGTFYLTVDNKDKVRENFKQVLSIVQSPDFKKQRIAQWGLDTSSYEGAQKEKLTSTLEYHRLDEVGFAFEMLDDYQNAIHSYEEALAIARDLNEVDNIRTEFTSIAFNYAQLKEWNKAADYYEQALRISRARAQRERVADDLADIGWVLMEAGQAREALDRQIEGLELYRSMGMGKTAFSLRYVRLFHEMARTYDGLGNRKAAIFHGKLGINALQDERQRLVKIDRALQKGFLRRIQKHYRRLADWLIAENRLAEAEQVLAMLKEQEISDYLRGDQSVAEQLSRRVDFTSEERRALSRTEEHSQAVSALGLELSQFEELRRKGGQLTSEQKSRLEELNRRLTAANTEFSKFADQLAGEFKQGKNPKNEVNEDTALQSDMKEWGGNLAFVYTLIGEDRYRTILITPDSRISAEKEIKGVDLSRKILEFREQVRNPRVDPRPLGKELYDLLIKPIEKELDGSGAKTLLWSLDGNLRLLPLAALWDGKQYFGQKYQNVTITLASRTRIGRESSRSPNVLGLGVSEAKTVRDALGERNVLFTSLPNVPSELTSIVRSGSSRTGVLPGASLLNAAFSEKAFEEQLAKHYKIIHVASHFSLNAGDAGQSFLVLGDGSILTVNELKNNQALDLTGVELLTLSACDTAVASQDSSGKEVDGFAYVAQQKGAKSILATLWPVADESTSILMSEFYRLRKDNPALTKSATLQLEQQEMIEGKLKALNASPQSDENKQGRSSQPVNLGVNNAPAFVADPKRPLAHPYYWSPFILIGNWK